MPETTEKYHRIPVAECEVTATIDISEEQGIKALYCGKEEKVRTYLFDTESWTMAEAKAWVKEHEEAKAVGEGRGAGGDRQGEGAGEGAPRECVCPKCGYEMEHERNVPCTEIKCPKCGAMMVGKEKAQEETQEEEKRSLDMAVKFLGETEDAYRVGGYGMVWGSEEQRDLSPWPNKDGSRGEFFTPDTQGLDDLPTKALTFEHDKEVGPDGQPFTDVLGKSVMERNDLIGRWVEALVEKRRKYAQYVMDMVNRGLLNFSSETASHWREVAESGEIKRWRTAGYTLTTHPMEPRLTGVNALAKSFKSVGLELAEPQEGGEPSGDGCLELAGSKARTLKAISRIRQLQEV